MRKRLIWLDITAIKGLNASATFGTDLWNMTKVTSEEVMFHMARTPFSLTQQVVISFPRPPIERSSELLWLWPITSYMLDLHATSHKP